MRRAIKNAITSTSIGYRILCEHNLAKQKLKIRAAEQNAKKLACPIYSVNELSNNRTGSHDVCHIIGSGWSLAESRVLAEKNNCYVIGFNFACLSGLEFDAYFIEFGGPACADIAEQQKNSLDAFKSKQKGMILFKNLWEDKNDIAYAARLYGSDINFIRDISIPCFNKRNLCYAANVLLKSEWTYLRQYKSSALTAINFARYLGFQDIVLHGVDFGGGYFFDMPEFSDVKELAPPRENTLAYNQGARTSKHPTAERETGIDKMIPMIEKRLRREGVRLYAATASSPLSELLPVFRAGSKYL